MQSFSRNPTTKKHTLEKPKNMYLPRSSTKSSGSPAPTMNGGFGSGAPAGYVCTGYGKFGMQTPMAQTGVFVKQQDLHKKTKKYFGIQIDTNQKVSTRFEISQDGPRIVRLFIEPSPVKKTIVEPTTQVPTASEPSAEMPIVMLSFSMPTD
jgi:hypothetical protein